MKPIVWSIAVLATATGCAGRQTTASPERDPGPAASQSRPRDSAEKPTAADEFDLVDEEIAEKAAAVSDPIEPWNRAMFQLNDALYVWIAKPFLEGYEKVAPKPVRVSISNAFHNVRMPARAINCLLQGKWDGAGAELRRFAINTTVGILGFRDVARSKHGLEPVPEDLGQTLATWGIGDGCYLVWPLFGPSNVRDSVGDAGDQFLNPLRYVRPSWLSISLSATNGVNEGSLRRAQYEALKAEAVDPYVAMRRAYVQYRRKKVKD